MLMQRCNLLMEMESFPSIGFYASPFLFLLLWSNWNYFLHATFYFHVIVEYLSFLLLPLFQIISRICKCIAKATYLEKLKRCIIWNGLSKWSKSRHYCYSDSERWHHWPFAISCTDQQPHYYHIISQQSTSENTLLPQIILTNLQSSCEKKNLSH